MQVRTNLSDPSPLGPPNLVVPFPGILSPGEIDNGGVWQGSLNAPWVWALTLINSTDAWEQWLLGTLGNEGDIYGNETWAGIWSSSDVVSSYLATGSGVEDAFPLNASGRVIGRVGQPAWDAFPILCTHRHAWPLWSLSKLAGIGFTEWGLELTPVPLPIALRGGVGDADAGIAHLGGARAATAADVQLQQQQQQQQRYVHEHTQQQGHQQQQQLLLWSFESPRVSIRAFSNGSWSGHYGGDFTTRGDADDDGYDRDDADATTAAAAAAAASAAGSATAGLQHAHSNCGSVGDVMSARRLGCVRLRAVLPVQRDGVAAAHSNSDASETGRVNVWITNRGPSSSSARAADAAVPPALLVGSGVARAPTVHEVSVWGSESSSVVTVLDVDVMVEGGREGFAWRVESV